MGAQEQRRLIELAAKAAGITVRWHEKSLYGPTMEIMDDESGGPPWNPLTDDGDALRLAVKLLFEIDMGHGGIAIRHATGIKVLEVFNHDPYAATRLAIVRAAAAIGEKMEEEK
jgi:hypothetical protein